MKGVVFTEFLEMVENEFGYETVDQIITAGKLPSEGVYTAVGTYDHQEMFTLVGELSKKTNIKPEVLVESFGKYLFQTFTKAYPQMFAGSPGLFSFLSKIEDTIHVEVQKLYPDAQLPTFDTRRIGTDKLEMIYHSERRLAMLAIGLIKGAIKYFPEKANVEIEELSETHDHAKIIISLNSK